MSGFGVNLGFVVLLSLMFNLQTKGLWSDETSAPGYVLSDFIEFLNLLGVAMKSI